MKNYTLLITKFFRCTLAEAVALLTDDQYDCLALETQTARSYTVEVTPLTTHKTSRTLFGVGVPL